MIAIILIIVIIIEKQFTILIARKVRVKKNEIKNFSRDVVTFFTPDNTGAILGAINVVAVRDASEFKTIVLVGRPIDIAF